MTIASLIMHHQDTNQQKHQKQNLEIKYQHKTSS